MDVGKIWDKVRDKKAGDAEYAEADPDFRARLGHVVSVVREGGSTDIAGMEKFEEAVRKEVGEPEKKEASSSASDAALIEGSGQARSSDGVTPEDLGLSPAKEKKEVKKDDKPEPMTEERAKESAAATMERAEAGPEHSPDAPNAARPLAAESAANTGGEKPRSKGAATKKGGK
jgi:hypothetical protein